MNHRSLVQFCCVFSCWVGISACSDAQTVPQLSAEQQAILQHLDDGTISTVLAYADKVEKLRNQIEAMKRGAAQIEADAQGPLVELALEFAKDAQAFEALKRSTHPGVRKVHEGLKTLREIGATVEKQWREAPFDPEEFAYSTEEDFREELREFVYAQADAMIMEVVDAELLAAVKVLKDPAAFVKQFVEQQLTQYFDQPYPFAGLEFTLARDGVDRSRSLFSTDANIKVRIVYDDEISVQAEGLYFRYRNDGLPEPMLDKLRVDDAQLKQQFFGKTMNSLADLFPAELGLPIKIKNVESLGFQPRGQQKIGGIKFDIEVKFSDELPAVEGKNVVVYPDGKVDFDKIGLENPNLVVPIGTTPLAFQGFAIEYAPGKDGQAPEIAGSTRISTTGTAKAYALELTLRVALPVQKIELEGNLILLDGNISVAWVQTTLDFTDGSLSGQYAMPGKSGNGFNPLPIGQMLASEGTFRLDGNGFVASGDFQIYGQKAVNAELGIMFNGHGYFVANGGMNVFGTRIIGELSAGYTPGFKKFWVDINMTVEAVSLRPWGELDVNVSVFTNQEGLLWLEADAGVASISVAVPNGLISSLTVKFLIKELERAATEAYHQLLDDMAREEKNGRQWAAAQEAKAKKWLHEHWGFTGKTGIKELDDLGGRFSDAGKTAGGILTDWREKLGGGATDVREGVMDGIKQFDVNNKNSALGKVFGGGGVF